MDAAGPEPPRCFAGTIDIAYANQGVIDIRACTAQIDDRIAVEGRVSSLAAPDLAGRGRAVAGSNPVSPMKR